ncbi:hypothetical protein LTR98_011466, partial [Exophiala xenobiotica]
RYFGTQRTPSVNASNQALARGQAKALEALYTQRKSSQMTFPPQATPPTNTLIAPRDDKWGLPPSPSIEFAPQFSARARSDTETPPTLSFRDVCDIVLLHAGNDVRVLEIYEDTLPVEHGLERPGPIEDDVYRWDCIVAAGSPTSRRQEAEVVYLLKWRGYPYEEMSWVAENELSKKDLSALWEKHGRPQAGIEARRKRKRDVADYISARKKSKAAPERKHPVQKGRHPQGTISDSIPKPSEPGGAEGVDLHPTDMVSPKTDAGKSASQTSRTVSPSRQSSGLPRGSGVIMNLPSPNVY